MPYLTLTELPPPPPGKTGWPWTEEPPVLPPTTPSGEPWPTVSIVTPSYNQGQFIEETIRSVLLQGYPNLEYLIIDGGSTDNSVEIIRKYEPWLTYRVSERDGGQSEALNKGFARTTGPIMAWLNSDDVYEPGAIQIGVIGFEQNPSAGVIYGDCTKMDEQNRFIEMDRVAPFELKRHLITNLIAQPAAFFSRSLWQAVGPLNTGYHYIMDYDLWSRAALKFPMVYIPQRMAQLRLHTASKTVSQTIKFLYEHELFFDTFFADKTLPAEILSWENELRGINFFGIGRLHLQAKNYSPARSAFANALNLYPFNLNKLIIPLFWLDSVLKIGFAESVYALAHQIKHGYQPKS